MVLAKYTEFAGNLPAIAYQCLYKLPSFHNNFTYTCDHHSFYFLHHDDYGLQCEVGSVLPHGRKLLNMKNLTDRTPEAATTDQSSPPKFKKRYGGGKADMTTGKSLNKEFGTVMKEHVKYIIEHAEEIDKLAKVNAQVSEVKSITTENIDKAIDRGENLTILADKMQNLRDHRTRNKGHKSGGSCGTKT